jgi:hypothetical protein
LADIGLLRDQVEQVAVASLVSARRAGGGHGE